MPEVMTTSDTFAGFGDPVRESQATFRSLVDAMSQPGRIVPLPVYLSGPPPLNNGAAAIALTLLDVDSPFWMDDYLGTGAVREFIAFHTGAPLVSSQDRADFAFLSGEGKLPDLAGFSQGSPEYPDRSATLIILVDYMHNDSGVKLSGPGIKSSQRLTVAPLPEEFWARVQENNKQFPLGLDFIFVSQDAISVVLRSTTVED